MGIQNINVLAGLHKRYSRNRLFHSLDKEVNNICRKFILNKNDTEDVKQDTLECIFRNLDKYTDDGKLENWVFTISRNMCNNFNRKNKSLKSNAELLSLSEIQWLSEQIPSPDFADALAQIIAEENSEELKAAILLLSPLQKDAVDLMINHQLSYEEIAEIMDKNEINIRVTIHNAEKKLKNILKNKNL